MRGDVCGGRIPVLGVEGSPEPSELDSGLVPRAGGEMSGTGVGARRGITIVKDVRLAWLRFRGGLDGGDRCRDAIARRAMRAAIVVRPSFSVDYEFREEI